MSHEKAKSCCLPRYKTVTNLFITAFQRIKKTHGPEFESFGVGKAKEEKYKLQTPKSSKSSCVDQESPSSSLGEPGINLAAMALDEHDLRCDFCRLTEDCNKNGVPEPLLVCKDCLAKGKTCVPVMFQVIEILSVQGYKPNFRKRTHQEFCILRYNSQNLIISSYDPLMEKKIYIYTLFW